VDSYSSHVNFAFIKYAIAHRITLLILPPYTTYCLQPLDVGIFGPLAHFFSKQIRALLNRGDSLVRSNKALFYKLFKPAFKQALTESNIKSSFAKCGIWPHDPTKVTSQLKKEEERPVTPKEQEIFSIELQTPLTVKSLRRFHLDFQKNPTRKKTAKLFSATLQLSAALAISRYAEEGLREAIILQKRKKYRKKLLLNSEEDKGQA
jgi:hypothetical protein